MGTEEQDGISVIIPIYNASKYLHRTIDSVLNQTYKDIELILVNDGSKDNSLAICREYEKEDERVVVIDKENGGVSSARNAGIERATKKYVAFMDNDDYMIPTYLETMHKYISMDGGRDLLVANAFHIWSENFSCDMDILKNDGHEDKKMIDAKDDEELKYKFIEMDEHLGTIWNLLYRRDIIVAHSLQFQNICGEDTFFNLAYIAHIHSMRSIMGYRGYCWIRRHQSQSNSFKYCPDVDWIYMKLDIEEELSKKFDVTRGSNFLLNCELYHLFITYILLKNYAKGTKREYDYRKFVMEKTLAFPIFDKCIRCANLSSRFFYFLMKKRLYRLCDIILLLYTKLVRKHL